ncbi:MAG: Gfo/Idh/MocA family protein [Nitrososphaerales archaeon]
MDECKPVSVGIIGAGMISLIYLANLTGFKAIKVQAIADIIPEKAAKMAQDFNIPKITTVEDLLSDSSIEVVVNLTIPRAHAEVTLKSIAAGKNVYGEKPLATNREDGKKILEAAKSKGVRVGSAPDTFLGGGFQTARKLLDDGWIGKPVAAVAFRADHGPDEHPNAAFFYQKGGGPLFDMGPYYLTDLVNLLGPIKRVTALARTSFAERTELSKAPWGKKIQVDVPTLVTGALEFHSGVLCSTVNSFDVWATHLPHIEIYGTHGTIQVPNPNRFGGNVFVKKFDQEEWTSVPPLGGFLNDMADYRGIGVLDMVLGIVNGREHRANLNIAYHVLDTMQSYYDSADSGKAVNVESTCNRPAPLPLDPVDGEISPATAYE